MHLHSKKIKLRNSFDEDLSTMNNNCFFYSRRKTMVQWQDESDS
jgi:hypothetical protein